MLLSDQAERLGNSFADLVIAEDWDSLSRLFSDAAGATPEILEQSMGWSRLSIQLARSYAAETGEETDEESLAPPVEKEVWNEVVRDNDYGPKPLIAIGQCAEVDAEGEGPFIEVNFLPDEDSGLDHCYRCYLTIKDGPRPTITGLEVSLILD